MIYNKHEFFVNKEVMDFIVCPDPPLELMDHFHKISPYDPIRKVLSCFSSFEEAIRLMNENDFEGYGVFIRLTNPNNYVICKQTSFFFHKPKLSRVKLVPIPPLYVYKQTVKQDITPFITSQQIWTTEKIISKLFSCKDADISFIAEDHIRKFRINGLLKNELKVGTEPVPLLVLVSPEQSLEFAGFVIEMLHQTSAQEAEKHIQNNQHIIRQLSVDRRRKLYDIFPEEFIHIPNHVWKTLKRMDDTKLMEDDVEELCKKYSQLSITS